MRIKLTYLAPLLAAGAAAVAIAAAPTAAAAKCAELLGKNLPVARQCSDQQRPAPRSVPPLRRHAVSARRPRRRSRRHGLTPNSRSSRPATRAGRSGRSGAATPLLLPTPSTKNGQVERHWSTASTLLNFCKHREERT